MIDHVTFGVSDLARSRAFYDQALAAIGIGPLGGDGAAFAGYGADRRAFFWIGVKKEITGAHVAFAVADRASVDRFYAAALQAGGQDNGAPGLRPQYHADYYGAFVLDPDGHNVEAVCRSPAQTFAGAPTIRPARADDTDAVRRLVHDAYGHYVARMRKPPGPMGDDYARRIADGQAWVLEDSGAIAGVLVLEDADGALLLDNVAVATSAQGKGYGRALVAYAEDEARRRAYFAVRLYTHALMAENIALYGRLGFRETGRVSEKGFDRVYMEKSLIYCVSERRPM